jgi:putative ABC transport system permease protein
MSIWLDFRCAVRTLAKSPNSTILAGLALALGIGANAAMFSIVRAAFLTSLPFPNEERLVMMWQSSPQRGVSRELVTPANFVDWDAQNAIFEALGAWPSSSGSVSDFNVSLGQSSERVRGSYVSSGFFRALGVQPLLGRTFVPEEDRLRDHRAAILSHAYWQMRFGADAAVLGKTIEVDTFRGGVYTIIGVMPANFDFPSGAQIFLPMAFWGGGPLPAEDAVNRCCSWFSVVGRLKPNVNLQRARLEMTTLARRISDSHSEGGRVTEVQLSPLRTEMVGPHRTGLLVLFGAVVSVLLIACTNVATLSMSRAVARSAEMTVRSALGAGTVDLVRLVFVESLLLSVLGAAGGMLLAVLVWELLVRGLAGSIPLVAGARMDWGVLDFTIAVSLASACFCAISPALQLRCGRPGSSLQGAVRSYTAAPRGSLLQQVFMATEVALAVALAIVAGLLIRTVLQLRAVDPGFRAEQVLAVTFDLTSSPFRGPGRQQPWFHELITAAARIPGVRRVGGASEAPLMRRSVPDQAVTLEGQPIRSASDSPHVIMRAVTPDYFPAMGIPLRNGRLFTEADSGDGKLVAIVNETAAHRLWPGTDPIGRRIGMGSNQHFGYFGFRPRPVNRNGVRWLASSPIFGVRRLIYRSSPRSFTVTSSSRCTTRRCSCARQATRCPWQQRSGGRPWL